MPPVGFEPTISTGERPQTQGLDRAATGTGPEIPYYFLTLRRLMSYIYMEHPFLMFLDHTQRSTTVGKTPLDE